MKNILIVEDNKLNTMLFQSILRLIDNVKMHCTDGESDVLDLVKTLNPDLVIMDIHLPNINGDEYIRQIRQEGYSMPIIAATAYEIMEERERIISLGATEFISKPIEVVKFKGILEKYL